VKLAMVARTRWLLRPGCRPGGRGWWILRKTDLLELFWLSGHEGLISRSRRRGVALSSSESRIQTTSTMNKIQLNMVIATQ
jgi:hypothetical protein